MSATYPKIWDMCIRCGQAFKEQDVPMLHPNGLMTHTHACVSVLNEGKT